LIGKIRQLNWIDDNKYELVTGGLIDTIMVKLNFRSEENPGYIKRAIFYSAVTWFPLMLLSIFEGNLIDENVDINFLEDFLTHIRFLLVVPFLVMIERVVDNSLDNYVNSTHRIIEEKEEIKFGAITKRLQNLSDAFLPEVIFILIIGLIIFTNWSSLEFSQSKWNLRREELGSDFSIAGIYYLFISIPIYELLLIRWFWRWCIWTYSVFKFSRLNYNIESTHADKMAGMEYLNIVPFNFGIVALSLAAITSALLGIGIVYFNHSLTEYYYLILAFIIVIPVTIYLPLLLFIPALIKAKIRGISYFGSLIQHHNVLYKLKWMSGSMPENENILGSLDNSSMADINGAYQQSISEMSSIPINLRMMISVMLILIIPFIPLLGTMYTFGELINKLIEVFMS